jgi:hypothetical protein
MEGEAMSKRKANRVLYMGESAKRFVERIGKTPAERLAWVIRFAQSDLAILRPEERIALARDLSLFGSLSVVEIPRLRPGETPMSVVRLDDDAAPMLDGALTAIHQELAQRLRGLMNLEPWHIPGDAFIFPIQTSKSGRVRTRFSPVWQTGEDLRKAIIAAVARLLVEHGEKVRACECGTIFVANRQQAYCSPQCSQRVRNQRRKEKEG